VREALCFGAGGAGSAVALALLYTERDARFVPRDRAPRRLVVTDVRADRLSRLGELVDRLPSTSARVELVHTARADDNDAPLARLAPGSLVINATGLGKDAPGSPIGSTARFPRDAVVWDANYRGELAFLRQARAQGGPRGLRVHDGWSYFVHGWAEALTPILQLPRDPALLARLATVAAQYR
jgi:shikimate 5-dehydrogenase